ncbi:MAG: glutathione S-transferase C-terminal domain-containing protein [Pseudomonadota bacterium]
MTRRFVTLLPSVDVDLGRWLLQLWGIDYVEEPHAPVFHVFALKKLGEEPDHYPVLIDGDKQTAAIERLVRDYDGTGGVHVMPDQEGEPDLYKEVFELQNANRYTMGNGVVNWAYFELMKDKSLVWDSFTTGVPLVERLAVRFGYSWIKGKMEEGLGLNEETAAKGLEAAHAGFDRADALLADGREWLAGDRMTIGDLSFATTGAPMVMEPKYGGHLPAFEALPSGLQKIVQSFRDRPAGKFVQKMYAAHRK